MPITLGIDRPEAEPLLEKGRVVSFLSTKGGSGKTLISATAAHVLSRAGFRVVCIDTDFSTRGLSLFMLGPSTRAVDLEIPSASCLVDAILEERDSKKVIPIDPKEVRPIKIARTNQYVVLTNDDFADGGSPSPELLRAGHASYSDKSNDWELKYLAVLKGVCANLTTTFDFVIIDTRGGFDHTSKVAAVVADKFVVIVEADEISIKQAGGLIDHIADFADECQIDPNFAGFIVNKGLPQTTDIDGFAKAISKKYGADALGSIPLDIAAATAYQHSEIPSAVHPGSEFASASAKAMVKLLASFEIPEENPGYIKLLENQRTYGRKRGGRLGSEWVYSFLPLLTAISLGACALYVHLRIAGIHTIGHYLAYGSIYGAVACILLYGLSILTGDRWRTQRMKQKGQSLLKYAVVFLLFLLLSMGGNESFFKNEFALYEADLTEQGRKKGEQQGIQEALAQQKPQAPQNTANPPAIPQVDPPKPNPSFIGLVGYVFTHNPLQAMQPQPVPVQPVVAPAPPAPPPAPPGPAWQTTLDQSFADTAPLDPACAEQFRSIDPSLRACEQQNTGLQCIMRDVLYRLRKNNTPTALAELDAAKCTGLHNLKDLQLTDASLRQQYFQYILQKGAQQYPATANDDWRLQVTPLSRKPAP